MDWAEIGRGLQNSPSHYRQIERPSPREPKLDYNIEQDRQRYFVFRKRDCGDRTRRAKNQLGDDRSISNRENSNSDSTSDDTEDC